MKIIKPKFWDKKLSLLAILLLPISLFLQIILKLKTKTTRVKSFSIPIICVGNIYLGGTGKTPLAIFLAKYFTKLKRKNAIIKKYYSEHEDELNLIKSNKIKVFNSRSRVKSVTEAIKKNYKILIMDDGYHDNSVMPILNILCFNSKQLVGNNMTIPSGPLRESFNSIRRSKIILINGKKNMLFEKKIKTISKEIEIFYSEYILQNIRNLKKKKILAFAGIGNPSNFFNLLKENKLKVIKTISFPDHYNYTLEDMSNLNKIAAKQSLEIVTTEKDFFRIKKYGFKNITYTIAKLKIHKLDQFKKSIMNKIK
tara:strand:- start:471 stop:1403 length:933 start_codon:yes stop_codon:yes gene_type:complete